MRLYYAAGVYVGTQADAKRLAKDYTQVEVPTDKDGLLAFLNRSHIAALATPPVAEPEDDITDLLGEVPIEEPAPHQFTATSVVSQIDTPGIEQMIEAIAVSKGVSLRRFAGAVATRFAELAK